MPSSDSSFLAVYGSLRRRSLAKQGFFVLRNLRFYGHGVLRGLLFAKNGYPAVLEQPGTRTESKFIVSLVKGYGRSWTAMKDFTSRLDAAPSFTEKGGAPSSENSGLRLFSR